jgi:hypothetical protein
MMLIADAYDAATNTEDNDKVFRNCLETIRVSAVRERKREG